MELSIANVRMKLPRLYAHRGKLCPRVAFIVTNLTRPEQSASMLSTTSVASGRTFAAEAVRLPAPCPRAGGTDSSNPASSSGESTTNRAAAFRQRQGE
jgi:hypothetical protein